MKCLAGTVLVILGMILSGDATLVKPRLYEIRSINSSCTSQSMKIGLEFNRKFEGVVYAKGFPLEKHCRSLGTGDNFVQISIDTSACGVRLISIDDEKFTYRISLSIQTDKYLQQINDLEVSATCSLSFNDMVFPSHPVYNRQISRTGRNKMADEDVAEERLNSIKSWMEIRGISESSNANKVSVGEETMVLIKSFLPGNVDANVIDCYAYDGTKDVAQKLIDDRGCPLDETIMPSLGVIKMEEEDEDEQFSGEKEMSWDAGKEGAKGKARKKTENLGGKDHGKEGTLHVMATTFPAFKFPDTSNLHLRCTLQICKQACIPESCDSERGERTGKSVKSHKKEGAVVDKIEVFNSVEVVAPGIDSDGFSTTQDETDSVIKTNGSNFCLSASKMAFSFAILGAVFLCGVLAALWTVMRNHLRKANKVDGSEQVLVVRDSPMSFTHSRNKMYHNWTYT